MTDLAARRRRAGADPVRHRILQALVAGQARTEEEFARVLRLSGDAVHFHLKVLADAEMIEVEGDDAARSYRAASLDMTWSWDEPVDLAGHVRAKMEAATARCVDAVFRSARRVEEGGEPGPLEVATPSFVTSADEVDAFRTELAALLERFRERAEGNDVAAPVRMRFAYALYDEPVDVASA